MSSTERLPVKTIFKSPRVINEACPSDTTLMQRNLLRAMMSEAELQAKAAGYDEKDNKVYIFKIPISTVKHILNIEWAKSIEVIGHLNKLADAKYVYNFLDGDASKHVIGSPILLQLTDGSPDIEFSFNPFLVKHILKASATIYANINLLTINKIKIDRADILYTYLVDYIKAYKIPKLTIKEFRNLLGIPDGSYILFSNFKMKILDPIMNEINEKTDINCSYQLIKGYRNSWASIQWTVTAKPGCNPTKSAPFNEGKQSKQEKDDTITIKPNSVVDDQIQEKSEPKRTYDEWFYHYRYVHGWSDEFAKQKANEAMQPSKDDLDFPDYD